MKYEIWSEGYRVTGESGKAHCMGVAHGNSFREACLNLMETLRSDSKHSPSCFNPERLTYWGCKLFDNETDARKSFD